MDKAIKHKIIDLDNKSKENIDYQVYFLLKLKRKLLLRLLIGNSLIKDKEVTKSRKEMK